MNEKTDSWISQVETITVINTSTALVIRPNEHNKASANVKKIGDLEFALFNLFRQFPKYFYHVSKRIRTRAGETLVGC